MPEEWIQIRDNSGIVNVKARLDKVTQVIHRAGSLADGDRSELVALLEELRAALASAMAKRPEDGERMAGVVEIVTKEATKKEPSKSFLNASLQALREAAGAVQDIAPGVIDIVGKLASLLAKIHGLS